MTRGRSLDRSRRWSKPRFPDTNADRQRDQGLEGGDMLDMDPLSLPPLRFHTVR